ncbi:14158_t:CDS:1, partial [Gigaspora rosea]
LDSILSKALHFSKISNNLWYMTPDSTNATKAAHTMSNYEDKQLKLLIAILK